MIEDGRVSRPASQVGTPPLEGALPQWPKLGVQSHWQRPLWGWLPPCSHTGNAHCGGGYLHAVTLATPTVGVATSMTLSARSASFSNPVPSGVDARTILTLGGRRCKKSSRSNVSSMMPGRSPRSCCILRRSWVGLLSPSCSDVNSNWSLRCSDAVVLLVSCSFRVL